MIRARSALPAVAVAMIAAAAAAFAGELTAIPATAGTPAIPAYVARPLGKGPFPTVLVLHGCDGFNAGDALVADRLAMAGYVGVALDTLTPRGVRSSCGNPAGSRFETSAALAALRWLRTRPYVAANRLGIVGFSMGAVAVLDVVDPIGRSATAPRGLRAVVAYYPSCRNRDGKATVPLLILDGGADDWTPAPPCRAMARAARAAARPVTIVTYPGATHAFNLPQPNRVVFGHHLRYDPSAAADAARRAEAFLAQHLKGSLSTPP